MTNPFANAGLESWNSPGAFEEVGKGIKQFGAAYAMDKSGLSGWLNGLNKQDSNLGVNPGGYTGDNGVRYNNPSAYQGIAPPSSAIPPQIAPPSAPEQTPYIKQLWDHTNTSFVNPQASRDIPIQQGGNTSIAPPSWDQQKGEKGIGDMFKQGLMTMFGAGMMG